MQVTYSEVESITRIDRCIRKSLMVELLLVEIRLILQLKARLLGREKDVVLRLGSLL